MFGSLAITDGQIDAFDFQLSTGGLGPQYIFDSATSPPGRYVLEVARRTLAAAPGCGSVVISNPILPFRGVQLADLVLAGGALPCPCVVTDEDRFPIAYVLPRILFDAGHERFLNLLSANRASADSLLLSHVLGQEVARRKTDMKAIGDLPKVSPQGFVLNETPKAWLLQCSNAVSLMKSRRNWASLPFAVAHPYHAGDVTFFSLASRLSRHMDFQRHVVCRAYEDIVRDCGSLLEPMFLEIAPTPHNGSVSDPTYFIRALETLSAKDRAENFIVYSRLSKVYSYTPFNLVDHARFSLGDPMASNGDILYCRPPLASHRSALPPAPLKVLMQLNGGWPLKTYPAADRSVLIRALRAMSCEVSVIDIEDAAEDGAQVVKAGSTTRLNALLDEHHVFVSVDSFPLHFASQVVGHPTVALFGSTQPCNSDAQRRPGYRVPLVSLPCNPCGSQARCQLTGGNECSNYVRPQEVIGAIFEVADEIYGTAFTE